MCVCVCARELDPENQGTNVININNIIISLQVVVFHAWTSISKRGQIFQHFLD